MGAFPDFSKGSSPHPGRRPNPTSPRSPLGMLLETAGAGVAGKGAQEWGSAQMLWEEGRIECPGRNGD